MRATRFIHVLAFSVLAASAGTAAAETFVYVSNAEDGDIGIYTLQADGALQPGARVKAGNLVMPMAVSPDKRFLYAAVRSKPFAVFDLRDRPEDGRAGEAVRRAARGELSLHLAWTRPAACLLGASYGGHQVGVNAIGKDGKVSDPKQVIPTGRNAHSIITDRTNRYVYRAAPRHRPDLPVQARREDRQADVEHAARWCR